MPNNAHKSAAVPFVNQKGERSMKRVKVERYVAGKKPTYAKDDDEEEYYTTEEEDDDNEEYEEESSDEGPRISESTKKIVYAHYDDDDDGDDDKLSSNCDTESRQETTDEVKKENFTDQDDDDDDPRFKRLKQIESKTDVSSLIEVQRTQQIQPKYEIKNVLIDEDDDEEEIRQRHALARKRQIEAPVRPKTIIKLETGTKTGLQFGSISDDENDEEEESDKPSSKRLETDDLLKNFTLTGISRTVREKHKTEGEERADNERLKAMLDQAKQEAAATNQIYKKIDQDIKREIEKEALAKGDIGAKEMTSVSTDDEDDELAYEEWKLREIKRVLRDRSERMLVTGVR